MMGRFVYSMNVSVDLRIEQVPGDNGAGEWLRIDEELHREFNAQARALALMVQGRVIYETMEEYWPRAGEDASLPDVCTHPAILGFGRPLFDDYDVPIDLALLEQRSFTHGVTMHRYAICDVSEASPC
jgi:hypothetical protein